MYLGEREAGGRVEKIENEELRDLCEMVKACNTHERDNAHIILGRKPSGSISLGKFI